MKTDNITSSFMALRSKLHRSALSFLRNDEDAKDAVQDAFFNLYNKGAVKSEAEARNKLFVVLRNICIDRLRKPHTTALTETEAEQMMIEFDYYEDIEKYESLLIRGLTDIQKRIYILVAHDNMEYDDIAAVLDMRVEAVRMNMSRARKKILDNYYKLNR